MSSEIVLSTRCYAKIVMHLLKYPHATVNGVILSENKRKSGKDGNVIEFVNAIPMFHVGHGLTPMLEVALLQISNYCKNNNLTIGGYYQANKYFLDSIPTIFAQKVAEKIWEQNNDAVLIMVNNFGLASALNEPDEVESAINLYQLSDGKWKIKAGSSFRLDQPEVAFQAIREFIFKGQHHLNLVDFDNHLDDISNDWSNEDINKVIDDWVQVSN